MRKVLEKSNKREERLYLGGVERYREYSSSGTVVLERWTLLVEGIAQFDTLTVDNGQAVVGAVPTIRYQYRDHLGSSVIEANELGQVISYEEFYPYGASAYRAASSGVDLSLKRYRFTGKERDEETGLDYFGVRYYASWLGRWTAGDPGGFVDGLNLYRYVRNNPVNGVDAEGYSTEPVNDDDQIPNLSLSKAQWIVANQIAQDGMELFGNNAGSSSFGYKVFSELIGLEGYKTKEERTQNLLNYFEERLEALGYVDVESDWRSNHMFYAVALMYDENAYIGKYTNLESSFNDFLDATQSIGGKFDILTARSYEIAQRSKSFDMMGLILAAYGASYTGGPINYQSTRLFASKGLGASSDDLTTIYRSVSAEEVRSITSGYLSFGEGAMEAKQFWLTKKGVETWNKTKLGGQYFVEVQVPKGLIGKGKPIDTTVQVDDWVGEMNATIGSKGALETVNSSIVSVKVFTNPAYYKRMLKEIHKQAKRK